jgi:hypothetical protein
MAKKAPEDRRIQVKVLAVQLLREDTAPASRVQMVLQQVAAVLSPPEHQPVGPVQDRKVSSRSLKADVQPNARSYMFQLPVNSHA